MRGTNLDRLFKAIGDADIEILSELLAGHPELVEQCSKSGQSPLRLAVQVGSLKIVSLLLDAGADPNARLDLVSPVSGRRESGVTALMYADSVEMIDLLVSAGADVRAVDSNGLSVFFQVGHNFESKLAEALFRHGAKPTARELQLLMTKAQDELAYRKNLGQASERAQNLEGMIRWCQSLA